MSMSTEQLASFERAELCFADLKSDDLVHWVVVLHEEGSTMLYRFACLRIDPEDPTFAWIFTEHQGGSVVTIAECNGIFELKQLRHLVA